MEFNFNTEVTGKINRQVFQVFNIWWYTEKQQTHDNQALHILVTSRSDEL